MTDRQFRFMLLCVTLLVSYPLVSVVFMNRVNPNFYYSGTFLLIPILFITSILGFITEIRVYRKGESFLLAPLIIIAYLCEFGVLAQCLFLLSSL